MILGTFTSPMVEKKSKALKFEWVVVKVPVSTIQKGSTSTPLEWCLQVPLNTKITYKDYNKDYSFGFC